jgi:predicted permease
VASGAVEVLSRLVFFIASPALLFVTLAHADVGAVFSEALVVTAVSSSVACLLYRPVGLLRHRPPGETAVGSMASGYVNAGNLGIPIATYALGNAAEVAPVMLFQLTVLAPVFSTVLDLTSARADGERPPLLRTVTAPVRNPIALASTAGLVVSATGLRSRTPSSRRWSSSATSRCRRCCWRSGCRCAARRDRGPATARRRCSPCSC